MKLLKNFRAFFFIILLSLISSCAKEKPAEKSEVIKKERIETNIFTKMETARDEGGGIFNSSRLNNNTTYDFATSNVMWRATLNSIEFMPLANVDYSGGVIITDWYSDTINSDESIKIKVQFLSDKLSANSVKIISHKKKCNMNNCNIIAMNNKFNLDIKNSIIEKAKELKIKDENNKNNR